MGVNQWSIGHCINLFIDLCDEAFTEREFAGILGLELMAAIRHGSKYKTTPLHTALQNSFGNDILFGGRRDQSPPYPVNVAVTSTSCTGREALVLANYSRVSNPLEQYKFLRADKPQYELGVWEAAAATSAAPGYFKEFYHQSTGMGFLDGALYHNNPVNVANRERKYLWPDVANARPDLLLSIGTGRSSSTIGNNAENVRSPSQ